MTGSEFKSSFMLPQDAIDNFLQFIQVKGQTLELTSKYQLGRFEIYSKQILVYQSGIVIFEDDPEVQKMITQYLDTSDIEHDDFETYAVTNQEEKEVSSGWEETPKGVWLTEQQIDMLIKRLSEELEMEKGEKHERGRFVQDDQILVINTNGVVYTIGGFEGILNLLREVITSDDPYKPYERLVILDEVGRWERIGPVCIALVDVMKPDQIQLQLEGIKDDTLSRNTDYLEFLPAIQENSSYYTQVITPKQINIEVDNRENYQSYLHNKYKKFLEGKLLNLNPNTLLIIDKELSDLIEHTEKTVVSRDSRDTPAIGISSTLANAMIDKWKEDWYKQTGMYIERHNLDQIRDHQSRDELGKEFLL